MWSIRKRRRVCTGSPLPGPLGRPVTCPTALERFRHFRSFLWPVLAPSARLVFQQSKEEPPFLKTSAGPALASFLDGSLQKNEHHRGPAMKGLEKLIALRPSPTETVMTRAGVFENCSEAKCLPVTQLGLFRLGCFAYSPLLSRAAPTSVCEAALVRNVRCSVLQTEWDVPGLTLLGCTRRGTSLPLSTAYPTAADM